MNVGSSSKTTRSRQPEMGPQPSRIIGASIGAQHQAPASLVVSRGALPPSLVISDSRGALPPSPLPPLAHERIGGDPAGPMIDGR